MLDLFIGSQRSEATKRNYAYDLDKWFRFLGDRKPNERLALEFRTHLEESLSASSAARVFNTCRSYYRWLRKGNPFEYIKSTKTLRNRAPRIPEDNSVDAMLNKAKGRDRAVLSLLLNGLRSAEVTRLQREDWQWEEQYGTFVLRVVGKGEKERRVPATLETVRAVSDYLSIRKEGSPWLLQGQDGQRMTTRQVQYVTEKYSGYKIRPHKLRHHYATRLIRAGANVFAVKDLLGHADVQTTQVYVNLDLGGIIEAAAKDPRNRKEEGSGRSKR